MKKVHLIIVLFVAMLAAFSSCNKKKEESQKISLEKLGNGDLKPSVYGIRGFNKKGAPIVHHSLNYLYEWDGTAKTFNKLGGVIPNPAQAANGRIVQDALGNYFYHSGSQGDVFMLNKTTNQWDTVAIAPGYKNQMIANTNGDILVYINNTTIGGDQSYYKKSASANNWVKVLDIPASSSQQTAPQFLSNDGRAFFPVSASASSAIDGSGLYNDVVLNTNTGAFEVFYDKADPDNLVALAAYNYEGFNSDYTSPNGDFYTLVPASAGAKTALYKISSKTLPAKFVKVTEFSHPPIESGSYLTIRGCKVNEVTGVVKYRSSCQLGSSSHKNLGVSKTSSTELTMLQHDGVQNELIAGPDGTVYVLEWEGYLYQWN